MVTGKRCSARARRRKIRRRIRRASLVLVLLVAGSLFGTAHGTRSIAAVMGTLTSRPAARSDLSPLLANLERRAVAVESEADALRTYHASELEPLIAALDTRMAVDRSQLSRIAIALIREGRANGIDPRLLVAVLLVENPWLDLDARSSVGAVGLMQVMPFHAGNWGCAGEDLTDPDQNICHGARILADALQRSRGDLAEALLRYNGCVRGTNTPDCHDYPQWVYQRAGADWMTEIGRQLGDDRTAAQVVAASPM